MGFFALAGWLQLEQVQARGSPWEYRAEVALVELEWAWAGGSLGEHHVKAAMAGQLELEWMQATGSPGRNPTVVLASASDPEEDFSSSLPI